MFSVMGRSLQVSKRPTWIAFGECIQRVYGGKQCLPPCALVRIWLLVIMMWQGATHQSWSEMLFGFSAREGAHILLSKIY